MWSRVRTITVAAAIVLAAAVVLPCSVFNYTWDGDTRVGRNLDWIQSSWGWVRFNQPTGGAYGAMLFGADDDVWPQGGMNDQGLVLGMAATPYLQITGNPGGLPMQSDFWDTLFATCATFDDVLGYLAQHDLSSIPGYFEQGQMLWTDRFGGSVLVEGDDVFHRSGSFQVMTNFLHSHPQLGGWPCPRYDLIGQALTGQAALTDSELVTVLHDAHGTLWGGYTVWSLLYRPADLTVTVFNRGDFGHPVTLDLAEELALGTAGYDLDTLFARHVFEGRFENGDLGEWSDWVGGGS